LIIQVESLLKLRNVFDDDIVPSYDLIILDEIESVLNQFSSTTFKNTSRETFLFLDQILKHSGKIISLDGDLDERAFHFLKDYGKQLNIHNSYNLHNDYIIDFAYNPLVFEKSIYDALDLGKKIVITTMSARYGKKIEAYFDTDNIYTKIKEKYPYLNVKIYTSTTGSDKKQKLKNVDDEWLCDVLIFSPTITSGVSFDMKHFDKLFGVICDMSCSPRDFHQMLKRVRKINDKDVLIYNLSKFQYHKTSYNYNQVKEILMQQKKIIHFHTEYEGNKIIYKLDKYDENYIYNEMEKMNCDKNKWLSKFIEMAKQKGYIIKDEHILESGLEVDTATTNLFSFWTKENLKQRQEVKDDKSRIKELMQTPSITHKEYLEIQDRKTNLLDNDDDNLKLNKYHVMNTLAVDILDEGILESYDYQYHKIYTIFAH
jgi:hypothetical protein